MNPRTLLLPAILACGVSNLGPHTPPGPNKRAQVTRHVPSAGCVFGGKAKCLLCGCLLNERCFLQRETVVCYVLLPALGGDN